MAAICFPKQGPGLRYDCFCERQTGIQQESEHSIVRACVYKKYRPSENKKIATQTAWRTQTAVMTLQCVKSFQMNKMDYGDNYMKNMSCDIGDRWETQLTHTKDEEPDLDQRARPSRRSSHTLLSEPSRSVRIRGVSVVEHVFSEAVLSEEEEEEEEAASVACGQGITGPASQPV